VHPEPPGPTGNYDVPHRNILRASLDNTSRKLTLAFLDRKKKGKEMELVVIDGEVEESQTTQAVEWTESVMKAAYDGNYTISPVQHHLPG